MTALEQWGDKAQYVSEPIDEEACGGPKVRLLNMTPDPLGAIAAACQMYEGKVVRNLHDVADEQRRYYWDQVGRTHLKAPLEFVQLHFMIEGVDRSFTHQLVRQRTAVYAQESLRFAVKEDWVGSVALPPSLADVGKGDPRRVVWEASLERAANGYEYLVANGIPAEDARGLLPHAVPTRIHWATNLRGLIEHAGNRLCTQAQFVWRVVFAQVAYEIANYEVEWRDRILEGQEWQQHEIASSFRPVCYELGHCPFTASFDRDCAIRDNVQDYAKRGVPSREWDHILLQRVMVDPEAGRTK